MDNSSYLWIVCTIVVFLIIIPGLPGLGFLTIVQHKEASLSFVELWAISDFFVIYLLITIDNLEQILKSSRSEKDALIAAAFLIEL